MLAAAARGAVLLLALAGESAASSFLAPRSEDLKPCTAKSNTSGNYFDINSLHVNAKKGDKAPESWHSRGHDYGANFTINFCGGVVEDLDDLGGVEDIRPAQYGNVSAYYKRGNKIFSIGQESQEPVVRGRKLVLTYTHGSYCPDPSDKRRDLGDDFEDSFYDSAPQLRRAASRADDRRKSTIISLLCERNPADGAPDVTISFVGSIDECSYFFEARTPAACPSADGPQGGLGPGGVFGVITLITGVVYLVGGVMYQRIVQHQRGWRQIPNYSMWSRLFGFLSDMFVILTSSCSRLPFVGRIISGGRKGYSRLSLNGDGFGHGGRRGRADSDDENRLIDQLDETWEE